MAYISGMGNSYNSGSSIYGNRNVISGLASGMDTESMIENAVSGYKMKISQLQQQQTIWEWKQNTYRDIIDKMAKMSEKYMSFSSSTNLLSSSFFNNAMKISSQGMYADKISASGQTSSDVKILGVKQLATATQYTASGLGSEIAADGTTSFTGSAVSDFTQDINTSTVAGTLTINYGDSKVNIKFGADELFKDNQGFVDALNKKLSETDITVNSKTVKASEKIKAEYDAAAGTITIKDNTAAGNHVYISGASEAQKAALGITIGSKDENLKNTTMTLPAAGGYTKVDGKAGDKLSGQELSITLDGVTRKITLPKYSANADPSKGEFSTVDDLVKHLNTELDSAFGKNAAGQAKVKVDNDGGKLKFTVQENSNLQVTSSDSSVINALGLKEKSSTYVDTRKTLGQIWGSKIDFTTLGDPSVGKGKVTQKKDSNGTYMVDAEGYRLKLKDGVADQNSTNAEDYIRVDEKGNALYDFTINGERVGSFNADTELNTVLNAVNSNTKAGVSVSYSQTTDQFVFTAKNLGAAGKVEFGGGLAQQMFNPNNTAAEQGHDAILSMEVNGKRMENVTRSDNSFTVDGLNIKLNGAFGYTADGKLDATSEAVSFTATADSDKVVSTVSDFVKDFNDLMSTIKTSYSTLPAQKGNGKPYLPLTDKDRESMTESAIKEYEEKAKQGLLFGDRDLSSLYEQLRQAITVGGQDGADMRAIGLAVEYKDGLTTLRLDEDKFRAALESTPDKVRDVFSKTMGSGSPTDGIMSAIKKPLDAYGKVTGSKGTLVALAGSPLAPTSMYNNIIYRKLNAFDEQIAALEKKMNSQVDRYTRQFSQLEQLIGQMNSQSGALAGLMGGF